MSTNAADLAYQARQYAMSLQAAGVDWLPANSTIDATRSEQSHQELSVELSTEVTDVSRPEALEPGDLEQRRVSLQVMDQKEVQNCVRCPDLVRNRTRTVFGVGNLGAELVFVGEAPGADEDKAGEPFVGAAGQLLNKIIVACKLSREEVYICNVIKCRPPQNRQPLADEIMHCKGYLFRQLEIIQPRFICCLGLVAAQTVLNTNITIGKLRKQIHPLGASKVVATYHPAYLLRNPNAKKDVWEDMKMLMQAMGRPVL